MYSKVPNAPVFEVYNVPLAFGFHGLTLYPFVLYSPSEGEIRMSVDGKKLRKHEFIHVNQIQKEGYINFHKNYIYNTFKLGYDKNPYEVEAYRLENK